MSGGISAGSELKLYVYGRLASGLLRNAARRGFIKLKPALPSSLGSIG